MLCHKCQDKGSYEVIVHGIFDNQTKLNKISFEHFCDCSIGKKKSKEFNNGVVL